MDLASSKSLKALKSCVARDFAVTQGAEFSTSVCCLIYRCVRSPRISDSLFGLLINESAY